MRGATLAACLAAFATGTARADTSSAITHAGGLSETDGASLYQHVCQGCHMANAKGATGAGTIPALADNPKLLSAGYPVYVVLHGLGGMPPVGCGLDDQQVAAVVNFVRTHFGNTAHDTVKPADIGPARPPASYCKPSE